MNRKFLQLAIGLLVSAFFIWLAFRGGGVTLAQVGDAFAKTNWFWAVPFMALTMASFYWRTFRWKLILDPVVQVPAPRLFGPLMIGFAFNNIFPARAGEFARPFALARQERIPFIAAFSTIIVERIVDIVTLLVLLVLMPFYITLDPNVSREFVVQGRTIVLGAALIESSLPKLSIISLILLSGVVSFMINPIKDLYIEILELSLRINKYLPIVPTVVVRKLCGFINDFAKGLEALKSVRVLLLVALHSAVIWCGVGFSFQMMSWGFPGIPVSYGQAMAFLVVTCVVISIPSSPGFWGLYEFGGMVALLMMGVVPDTPEGASQAFAFTLVVHFLQWVPITAYGLWAAGKLSISSDSLQAAESATSKVDPDAQASV
ncbi:flippase-like domain-containing protein [bacterium]|nr:flippase-like domain-containing protein [bacterium]